MKHLAFLLASVLAPISSAWGLTLGNSTDTVVLGRPLDLRFAIQPDAGHSLANSCLDVSVLQGQSMVPESRLTWLPTGANTLHVQTSVPMTEPVVTVRIAGGCSGRMQREYTFLTVLPTQLPEDKTVYYPQLQDPRTAAAAPAVTAPAPESMVLTLVQPHSADEADTALPQGASVSRSSPARAPSAATATGATTSATAAAATPIADTATAAQASSSPDGLLRPTSPKVDLGRGQASDAAPSAAPNADASPATTAADHTVANADPSSIAPAASGEQPAVTTDGGANAATGATTGTSTGAAFNPRTSEDVDFTRPILPPADPFAAPAQDDDLLSSLLENTTILGAVLGLLIVLLLLRLRAKQQASAQANLGQALKSSEAEVLELARASAQARQPLQGADAPLNLNAEAMAAAVADARTAAPSPAPQSADAVPTVREALMQTISPTNAPTLAEAMAEAAQPSVQPARKGPARAEDLDRAAQAWPAVQEKAEFYASIGEHDQAIELLQSHLAAHPGASPQAYLDLLGIFFRLSRTEPFEQTRQAFERDFNVSVPGFTGFARRGRDLLGGWPEVLAEIEARWPEDATSALLHDLIVRVPQSSVVARKSAANRAEPFDLAAFEDLLMLRSVAQTTPAAERGLLQGRVRTTPKEAALPELILDGVPSTAPASAKPAQAAATLAAPADDDIHIGAVSAASFAAGAAASAPVLTAAASDLAPKAPLDQSASLGEMASTAPSAAPAAASDSRTPAPDLPPLNLDLDLASVVSSPAAPAATASEPQAAALDAALDAGLNAISIAAAPADMPTSEASRNAADERSAALASEIAAAQADAASQASSDELLPSFDFSLSPTAGSAPQATPPAAPASEAKAAADATGSTDIPSIDLSQFNFDAMGADSAAAPSTAPTGEAATLVPTLGATDAITPSMPTADADLAAAPDISFEPPPPQPPLSEMLADMFSSDDEPAPSSADNATNASADNRMGDDPFTDDLSTSLSADPSALPVPNLFPDEEIAQLQQQHNNAAG